MTDRELMQQALEALKELRMLGMNAQWHDSWLAKPNEAITAIREALAEQPAQQQEPVAYASDVEFDDETEIIPAEQKGKLGTAGLRIPLYIDPPASKPWVGLVWGELPEDGHNHDFLRGAAWAEAKLREKNGGEYRNGATTERTKLNQENT